MLIAKMALKCGNKVSNEHVTSQGVALFMRLDIFRDKKRRWEGPQLSLEELETQKKTKSVSHNHILKKARSPLLNEPYAHFKGAWSLSSDEVRDVPLQAD